MIQLVSILIGGASAVLIYLEGKVELPSWTSHIANVEVIVNSAIALFLAQLPNVDKLLPEN